MPEPLKPSLEERSREDRSFRNDDAELRPLSEWFREFARRNGVARPRALNFELCLNELVTNVTHYAWEGRGEHEIRIALERESKELRATVEDDGRPFNPLGRSWGEISFRSSRGGEAPPHETRKLFWGIGLDELFALNLHFERR